jgi:tripartite-type tricarboxylate transporter receptor subunit TctC
MAGVDLISVHYRGGGLGLVDLLAGQVQVMFEGITSSMEYVRAGNARREHRSRPIKKSP